MSDPAPSPAPASSFEVSCSEVAARRRCLVRRGFDFDLGLVLGLVVLDWGRTEAGTGATVAAAAGAWVSLVMVSVVLQLSDQTTGGGRSGAENETYGADFVKVS